MKELLAFQRIEQRLNEYICQQCYKVSKLKLQIMSMSTKTLRNANTYCRAWMVFATICDSCCSIHNTRIRGRPSTPCLCDLFDKLF